MRQALSHAFLVFCHYSHHFHSCQRPQTKNLKQQPTAGFKVRVVSVYSGILSTRTGFLHFLFSMILEKLNTHHNATVTKESKSPPRHLSNTSTVVHPFQPKTPKTLLSNCLKGIHRVSTTELTPKTLLHASHDASFRKYCGLWMLKSTLTALLNEHPFYSFTHNIP